MVDAVAKFLAWIIGGSVAVCVVLLVAAIVYMAVTKTNPFL
jgi:hypothetical protein